MTFREPTHPQRQGWEAIASGRDTLIVAPTGSGKTLASFLWALDHLHRLGLDGRLEDRVRLLAAGYNTHVAKPVEPVELVIVLAALTRRPAVDTATDEKRR